MRADRLKDVWTISEQFFAEHRRSTGSHPSYRHEEPASPTTCIALLTGGLLVRIQPEEPLFSMSWRRRPIRDLNNSERFGRGARRAVLGAATEIPRWKVARALSAGQRPSPRLSRSSRS